MSTVASEDRINGTASDSRSVVADLWSMDDMLSRPFHAVEASETVTEEAAPLLLTQPHLALRLRAAQGSSIEAGTLLRLFLRPLTQWALPEEGCPAQCAWPSVPVCSV
ncbi:unnamed protein product [Symbiodinium necroappetens]|uniref:Uncharacterized protein n=1 Tax=Symbiodinium necroappetens TaxID=1628268 RepID=A0A812KCW8_9DINO|nr:unnamed protein product [Symbiodinium necroappetens]